MQFKKIYEELKRRNVFRVGMVYGVTAWLIIQIVDTVFPILELPEWSVTLITVVILIGFPFALIFAWAFELTPDGLKRSDEVVQDQSIAGQTGKKINRLTVISLSFIIVFLLTERIFFAGNGPISMNSPSVSEASIAVLPFVNMSPDPDNEYFSDGLSEELLNVLAKVDDLKVAGRTSSFKFKGQNDDLKVIGEELGVDHILEGSVRKSGERIRITVQLVKVEDGYHSWSETYDRELTDIFEIQDEISRNVLEELKVRLLDDEEKEPVLEIPTQDLEAYEAYLKANHLMLDRQIEKMRAAVELYETAIKLDPTFAEAYARMAISHHLIGFYGAADYEETQQKLKEYSEQALSLNDQLGEAYGGLGLYYSTTDYERSTEYYLKSLQLNENQPDVYNWLGNNYETLGQLALRNEAYMNAYELDRLAPLSMYNRARVYVNNGELDEAEELLTKNIRLNPGFIPANRLMGNIILQREGRFDKAMISVHKSMENNTTNVTLLADLVFYSFELGMTDIVAEYREKLGQAFPQSREYGIATSLYSILKEDVDLFNTAILAQVEQYNVIVPEPQFYGSLYAYVEIGGDAERVIKQFQKFEPALLSDTLTTLTAQGYMVAAPLMGILHASKNGEQLKRLVNAFCAYGERLETEDRSGPNYRRYISNRMFCYMSKGNLDEAFPYFETYYQELSPVFFDYYILFNSGVITEAMSDPRYAAIRDTIKVRIEDQKENLRQYFAESE